MVPGGCPWWVPRGHGLGGASRPLRRGGPGAAAELPRAAGEADDVSCEGPPGAADENLRGSIDE